MEKKKSGKRKAEVDKEEEKELVLSKKKGKKSTQPASIKKEEEKKPKVKQGTLDNFNITIKSPESETDFKRLPELPKNSNIKIVSWNVNGLRATINKGSLENFIKKEQPDILCLNETKIDISSLKKEKYDKLYLDDYMSFWNCCKVKSGYSGVAIFSKYRPIEITYGIKHNDHDDEGRVITAEYDDFYVVSVYVPNAGEGLKRLDYRIKQWDKAFFLYINSLKEKKDVIVSGDLNVAHKEIDIYEAKGHLKSAGFTPEERESFTKFLDDGYIDTFRHLNPDLVKFSFFSGRIKSHRENNKGWRLDYFVINQDAEKRLVDSDIYTEYEGSDHLPIKLIWKV